MLRFAVSALTLALLTSLCDAHYNMLLPSKPWAEKGEKITFTYQFGHPYEHELENAPKPLAIRVFKPGGMTDELDLGTALTAIKIDGGEGKKVVAWQFDYTPSERGDFTFALKTPIIKHGDEVEIEDIVRVVLHVQTQNGWVSPRRSFPSGVDIWPYTRPYGLLPGMVFKGRAIRLPFKNEFDMDILNSLNGLVVEVEKYNPTPPKNLPPERLITFKTKTDPHGFFVTSLPESGWWGITALMEQGGKTKTIHRATHWVHVHEKK